MEAFLRKWLQRILPNNCTFYIYTYQGKHALLRKIQNRLNAYSKWMTNEYRIIVLVDRDGDDCKDLKYQLEKYCRNSGLRSKTNAGNLDWQVVTRIAIEELEAWYFGDWTAVRKAYPRVSNKVPGIQRYRDPDSIQGGTWEAFERILQRSGYYKEGLPKVQTAKDIGKYICAKHNKSHSFSVFHKSIIEATRQNPV